MLSVQKNVLLTAKQNTAEGKGVFKASCGQDFELLATRVFSFFCAEAREELCSGDYSFSLPVPLQADTGIPRLKRLIFFNLNSGWILHQLHGVMHIHMHEATACTESEIHDNIELRRAQGRGQGS